MSARSGTMGRIWLALALLASSALAGDVGFGFAPGFEPFGSVTFGPVLVPDTFFIAAFENEVDAPPGSVAFFRIDVALNKSQSFIVRAFGLPEGSYQLVRTGVGGTATLGSFSVASDGLGKISPDSPSPTGFVDWFVNGNTLRVQQDSTALFSIHLEASLAGGVSSSAHSMVNGARLVAVGHDLDARGRLVMTADGINGTAELTLDRLDPGPYVLEAQGEARSFVMVGAGGKGSLRTSFPLKQGTGRAPLASEGSDFLVRSAAGEIVLAAQMPYDPKLQLHRPPGHQKFHDVGADADDGLSVDFIKTDWAYDEGLKTGTLTWQRDALASGTLSVDVNAPKPGASPTYDLFVDNVLVGSFGTTAADAPAPLHAVFAVGPDVDLRGRYVELRQGFQVGLSLWFPQSVPAGLRAYRKDLRSSHHLRLDLLNPGTDLDATGQLDWRKHKGVEQLSLSVSDLPAGSYDVVIDGLVVAAGALVVAEDGGSAEQLFSTDGALPGSLPLDFAVIGELQIRATGSATEYLRQTLDH